MMHILEEDKEYVLNTYQRLDLVMSHGNGSYLYDVRGNKYLDMYSGIAVNNLGHDKLLSEIMVEQARKYVHVSNYFVSQPVVDLAKKFVHHTFASKVFFANTGTESNEAAIKLCKKYGRSLDPNKVQILSAYDSFHGRTTGALTLTGQSKYQDQFQPLMPGVAHFKFNDVADLRSKVSHQTCAVFLEMIQGEGGVVEITQDFMAELVSLSNEYDFLIVVDEVQTGMGRCGDLFAFEKYGFTPDLVTVSKSVGGGLPLGVMLVAKHLETVFQPGDHGSTFAPNPVACACGGYVLDQLINSNLCQEVREKGQYLLTSLDVLKAKYPTVIKDIRGRGFMIGIEVGEFAAQIKQRAQQHGVLLNSTNHTVIRLLPALTMSDEELNEFLSVFETVLKEVV
ncbi:MAG TPA: aspartate aminotransferase family protein [Firmicutes bacterium]|nr:aspartate aminotransferase family protein [Bacillota bacterium]